MTAYTYRTQRLSGPLRAALVLAILLAVGAGVALLRASDALTRAYRWGYVALAYPVAWTLDLLARLRHGLHTGRLKSGGLEWSAWVGNAAARYPTVQGRPYHTLVVSEAAALAILAAVVTWRVGWFIYTRPRRLTPSGAHGTARWMTRREMKKLAYRGAPLLLGARGGVSVAMDRGLQVLNTLVIGPIGSGKTTGFILANLLRETGARDLVITDLKMELLAKTYTHLATYYDVWVVNFLSPATSMGYNPLACCVNPLLTALWCDGWIANTGKSEKEPFWDTAAREVLMSGIFHLQEVVTRAGGVIGDVTLAHLDEFLTGQPPQAVIEALEQSPSRLARKKAFSFMAALKANDKLLGSVFAEITPRFTIMSDERVQATTSRDEVKLTRLGTGEGKPVAVFLALDPDLMEELKPLSAGFFMDLFRVLGDTARQTPGGELRRDVFIYGDEWGNIGFVAGIKKAMNLLRSAGVYGVYVVQMTAQMVETYGELGWTQLKGAYNTKIALSNLVDEDATWFSEAVLGETTEVTQGRNVQRDRFRVLTDRGGQSQSETKRALLTPDEVMNLREDELLVKMPQRPPARLTQRRYYDDREVKRRAPARGQYWVPPLGPERADGLLTPPPPLELPPPAPVESQAAQPEHDHDAGGTGNVADAADTATGDTTRGTGLVVVGVPASLEDEADPFGPDVEH
jgi:type IV secretion system protein VirD4